MLVNYFKAMTLFIMYGGTLEINDKELLTTAVKNPDDTIAVAVFNPTDTIRTIEIKLNNKSKVISINAKALQTIIIKPN